MKNCLLGLIFLFVILLPINLLGVGKPIYDIDPILIFKLNEPQLSDSIKKTLVALINAVDSVEIVHHIKYGLVFSARSTSEEIKKDSM